MKIGLGEWLVQMLVCVLIVGSTALAQTNVFTWVGDTGAHLGQCVSAAGDVNNDGYPDLMAGTQEGGPEYVRVYSGRDGALLHQVPASPAGTGSSNKHYLSGAGDLDGDGHDDFVVGEANISCGASCAGLVSVYSGKTGSLLFPSLQGVTAQFFGYTVASIKDIDEGGLPDIIVGAPEGYDSSVGPGFVRVYSSEKLMAGLSQDQAELCELTGDASGELFGRAVSDAGDVDGDGYHDILVGDAKWLNWYGAAYVFSGKACGMGQQVLLYSFFNPPASGGSFEDSFGSSVDGVGDIGGPAGLGFPDGLADFAVGSPGHGIYNEGRVYFYSGADGAELGAITGFSVGLDGTRLGHTVSGLGGDIDGDSIPDVVLGTRPFLYQTAYVHSGNDLSLLFEVAGNRVSCAGDVNKDGTPDILTGTPLPGSTGYGGRVRVLSGKKMMLAATGHEVELSQDEGIALKLDAGTAYANKLYFVGGTASGVEPGTTVGSVTIPLNQDVYTNYLLRDPFAPVPIHWKFGTLDAAGKATATFKPPVGFMPPGFSGSMLLDHAFVVFDTPPQPVLASNPVPVTLLP